jgi:Ni,Fe-hydrogenase III small subunit/formate hydrogenlyase subunit 6/NADH:ubiquinone oxidoreductase subunit I
MNMFKSIKKIIQYPRLTQDYPRKPVCTDRVIAGTQINSDQCNYCGECAVRCPSQAIIMNQTDRKIGINYDQCIFCVLCHQVCPTGAVSISQHIELAEKNKDRLRNHPTVIESGNIPEANEEMLGTQLKTKIHKMFGRSLQIREVDSGSCNGCDYEINALNNPFNDIERLGISFVASPRHADMLLVTGTAVRNMQQALVKTYQATPDPKLVVAVGACACSGGIFRDSYAANNGIDRIVPVDVYIPGCPPRPQAILYGILKALDRV